MGAAIKADFFGLSLLFNRLLYSFWKPAKRAGFSFWLTQKNQGKKFYVVKNFSATLAESNPCFYICPR